MPHRKDAPHCMPGIENTRFFSGISTLKIDNWQRPPQTDKIREFGLTEEEIADLYTAHRQVGFFRQELVSGRAYFSEQAYAIYGMEPTDRPANIMAMVRKTHPDDVEMVAEAFETASSRHLGFHIIHRFENGQGGYKFLRLVAKIRDGKVAGGELVGLVYEFYDHLSSANFEDA